MDVEPSPAGRCFWERDMFHIWTRPVPVDHQLDKVIDQEPACKPARERSASACHHHPLCYLIRPSVVHDSTATSSHTFTLHPSHICSHIPLTSAPTSTPPLTCSHLSPPSHLFHHTSAAQRQQPAGKPAHGQLGFKADAEAAFFVMMRCCYSSCSTSGWIHIPEPTEMHNRFPVALLR
jgi:hypothetical protein